MTQIQFIKFFKQKYKYEISRSLICWVVKKKLKSGIDYEIGKFRNQLTENGVLKLEKYFTIKMEFKKCDTNY